MLCSGPQRILRPLPPAAGVVGPPRYEIFHDVMGPAVLDWRRRYVAQQERDELSRRLDAERAEVRAAARTARRRLLRRFAVVLAVALLVAVVSGVAAVYYNRKAQQQTKLAQAAAAMGYNPVQSLQSAAEAYQLDANEEAQEAVLRVASSPRSRVVAGPRPVVAGMVATPDLRHAVAFDALGGIRVIGADGAVKREVTASGLPGAVQVADVNPDASRVVLATDQGTAAVIDTATGARITEIHLADRATPKVLSWIGDATNGLVFLVSGSGRAATYNPETGHQVVSFPEAFEFLSLAREQHIVTSSEKDRKLRVWDARTATVIAESSTLAAFPQYLRRYGQSVVGLSLDENSSIVVWNGQAGSDPVQYRFDYTEHVQQVFVDEQAGTISIATDQGMATYSLTGSRQGVLHQWAGRINDVATSPDGRWLTTAGADGRVLVHFLEHQSYPNRPTYELLAHHGQVTQVKYLHGGTVVMSLGIDGTVRRWELPPVPRFEHHAGGVVDMDSSRDGSLLATASVDGGAFVMDRRDLSKVRATRSNAGLVSLRFDPTNPHCVLTLVQYSTTPELWRWDGGNQECTQTYAEPPLSATDNLVSLAVSPDGLIVAGADTRGTIHLWDARTGTLRPDQYSLGPGWPYYAIAFDPASRLIAATGPDKVRVWNLGNTTPLHTLPHPNVTGVAFDPSGQQLISTAQDGTVYIWTIPGGTLDQKLVAHGHPSSNPAFSTDGRLFAVGSAEGLVEVWNVHSGRTVMLDRHHSDSVRSVIFPPDRSAGLISASDDTTVAQFPCLACSDPDRATREAVEWARAN
jgi:WD40 repeat protein